MPQAARAVDDIMLMMSIIPTVGAVIAIIALWFCKLDEATVTQMGEALKQRRGEHEGAA